MKAKEYKVLITTSGTGSRLSSLTKTTNKALVVVNNRPVLSYILDRYSSEIPLVITLGYLKEQIVDFISKNYPDRNVEYVEVDKFEGPGTSCGYSILKAKNSLQSPFIFHACDTIVFEDIPTPDHNWTAGYINSHIQNEVVEKNFTTHKTDNLNLLQVNPLGETDYSHIHIGITAIKDYLAFWDSLEALYQQDPQNSKLTDINVINQMIKQGYSFKTQPFKIWLDTGNPDTLAYTENFLKK